MRSLRSILIAGMIPVAVCTASLQEAAETPDASVRRVHELASRGEWAAYWDSLSERGRGWLIAEASVPLAYAAYAQPIKPEAGLPYHRFLEKYKLQKNRLERREGESIDEMCRRISRQIGAEGPDLCRGLFTEMEFPIFPGAEEVMIVEQSTTAARVRQGDLSFGLVRKGQRWYIDGGFPE